MLKRENCAVMPSNSGLFEGLDDESLSNELSPTDGYFSQRPRHPQDVLVPDPSQNSAEANKAREAREDREADTTSEVSVAVRRGSQATAHSTSSRRGFDTDFEDETQSEVTPLIPPAPPAYSAATADRQYSPPKSDIRGSTGNTAYRQYNTMGRSPVFLPDGQPTDFGQVPLLSDTDHETPVWKRKARSYLPRNWRSCAIFVVIAIALLIGGGFILSVIHDIKWDRVSLRARETQTSHTANDLVQQPNPGPTRPAPVHPEPLPDKTPGTGPSSCPSATRTSKASFSFLGPDFTFTEFVRSEPESGRRRVRTLGELHVRSTTEHLEVNVQLELEIHYSEPGMMKGIGFVPHEESLSMYSPSHVIEQPASSPDPCMYFVGTLWIAPGARFDFLNIQTQSMKIIFHDDLDFAAEGLGVDAIGANSVTFPTGDSKETNINSRKVIVHTVSGSVHGTYPLYDLLEIKSRSGSITIDVAPKEASASDPKPAVLYLDSLSGTIQVNTPILATSDRETLASLVPSRDYQTTITSMSGSLRLDLIHGSHLVLKSTSGSITANLSPYGDPEDESTIITSTETGSTAITVLSSLSSPRKPLRKFYGAYKYKTGSLQIQYPREWEGTVEGTTLTGSISVHWPGLEIENGNDGKWRRRIGWHSIKAVKGHGEGRLEFHGVTGSVTLLG